MKKFIGHAGSNTNMRCVCRWNCNY